MSETIREIGAGERKAAVDLWDRCFPVVQGSSYLEDFPVWDPGRDFPGRAIFGAFAKDRLVALAGYVESSATLLPEGAVPKERIPAALIGAVCTDSEARGQGLATELVSRLVSRADERGIPLSVLWSGEHALYERLGFRLGGTQWRVPLSQFSGELPDSGGAEEGWEEWMAEAFRKADPTREGVFASLPFLSAHRNVRWFGSRDPLSGESAFAAMGRGMDLPAIVHEWGGEKERLGKVLSAALSSEPAAEILIHPMLLGALPFTPRDEVDGIAENLALLRWSDKLDIRLTEASSKRLWFQGLEAV